MNKAYYFKRTNQQEYSLSNNTYLMNEYDFEKPVMPLIDGLVVTERSATLHYDKQMKKWDASKKSYPILANDIVKFHNLVCNDDTTIDEKQNGILIPSENISLKTMWIAIDGSYVDHTYEHGEPIVCAIFIEHKDSIYNINVIKNQLDTLTSEQRMDLFKKYCLHCGDKNPKCKCWNDL